VTSCHGEAGLTVDVDVQAVLAGLALGHVVEQQPPAAAAPMRPAASSCLTSALGSSTSYSRAAAQKSARADAFVLSMTSFQLKAM
jgi:hypothetical protein